MFFSSALGGAADFLLSSLFFLSDDFYLS